MVRLLLAFVFRGVNPLTREVVTIVGPLVSLGAAASVLALCALGRLAKQSTNGTMIESEDSRRGDERSLRRRPLATPTPGRPKVV